MSNCQYYTKTESHRFMHLLAASRYCYEISLFIIWSSNKSQLNINVCALVLQQRQIVQRAISLLCASLLQFILQSLNEKHPLGAFRRKSGLPQVTQSWSTAENSLSTGGREHSKPLQRATDWLPFPSLSILLWQILERGSFGHPLWTMPFSAMVT